jgi:hypothetical protein
VRRQFWLTVDDYQALDRVAEKMGTTKIGAFRKAISKAGAEVGVPLEWITVRTGRRGPAAVRLVKKSTARPLRAPRTRPEAVGCGARPPVPCPDCGQLVIGGCPSCGTPQNR